jgi:hypothetical protein
MTSNPATVRFVVAGVILLLLAGRRIYGGVQRGSITWILIGMLFLLLATFRFAALWTRMGGIAGPTGSTGVTSSSGRGNGPAYVYGPGATSATPPRLVGQDPTRKPGQDGWSGRYEDARGMILTVTIPPPDSQGGREAAAPFAGAKKLGAVATVALRNNSTREARLDTAGAALYFTDGTQDYPSNPARVIDSIESDRAAPLQVLKPPYRVAPGAETAGVLFVPFDADFANLDHIRLTLDGVWVDVPGQVVRGDR